MAEPSGDADKRLLHEVLGELAVPGQEVGELQRARRVPDNCSSKIKGWKGDADGDWGVLVANGTWYTGPGSCKWGTYTVRSRSIQKTLYADGHVITSTAINAGHPHI